jgi:hypothetical protein
VVQQLKDKFFNPVEIVWFDPGVNSKENKIYANALKKELKVNVNTFIDFEKAVKFIQEEARDRRILVICCGSSGEALCKRIDMDINVIFVYIFTSSVRTHRYWAQKYYKIQGVYSMF